MMAAVAPSWDPVSVSAPGSFKFGLYSKMTRFALALPLPGLKTSMIGRNCRLVKADAVYFLGCLSWEIGAFRLKRVGRLPCIVVIQVHTY